MLHYRYALCELHRCRMRCSSELVVYPRFLHSVFCLAHLLGLYAFCALSITCWYALPLPPHSLPGRLTLTCYTHIRMYIHNETLHSIYSYIYIHIYTYILCIHTYITVYICSYTVYSYVVILFIRPCICKSLFLYVFHCATV